MHMVSVGHMYRRFKEEVLTATAQKASHDLLSAYILSGWVLLYSKTTSLQ